MTEEPEIKNQEGEIDLLELAKTLWNKRKFIIKYALVGTVVGLIIGFSIPAEYTTTVKMAPEGAKSSQMGGMADLAALAGVSIGGGSGTDGINLSLYPDVVSSTPFIAEISTIKVQGKTMKQPVSLYDYTKEELKGPWWGYVMRAPMAAIGWVMSIGKEKDNEEESKTLNPYKLTPEQSGILLGIQERIYVMVDKKTGTLTASARMQDPQVAATVADSLVSMLQEYITNYRTEKARQDYEFTKGLLDDARTKYYEAQRRYANYVDANRNVIRESSNLERTRLSNEQQLAYGVYSSLAQQLELAKIKVQEQTPCVTIIEPASIPVRKSNTGKLMFLIAFTFLGGCAATGIVVVKSLLFHKKEGTDPAN